MMQAAVTMFQTMVEVERHPCQQAVAPMVYHEQEEEEVVLASMLQEVVAMTLVQAVELAESRMVEEVVVVTKMVQKMSCEVVAAMVVVPMEEVLPACHTYCLHLNS